MTDFKPLRYIYQPAPEPAARTLLLLHGTGGDEHDLLPLAAQFGPYLNVLSLRGNVSENGMPRFFRRLGMGIFDENDVIFRAHEMVQFITSLGTSEGFDAAQLVAVGYSNGANMAGALLMLYPELLAGAVLWRPMQALIDQVPTFASKRQQPVLFSPGTQDPTVQPAASTRYETLLAGSGFNVSRHDTHAGHNLTQEDVATAAVWYRQYFPAT